MLANFLSLKDIRNMPLRDDLRLVVEAHVCVLGLHLIEQIVLFPGHRLRIWLLYRWL
jgi:hypothetical protein